MKGGSSSKSPLKSPSKSKSPSKGKGKIEQGKGEREETDTGKPAKVGSKEKRGAKRKATVAETKSKGKK